MSMSTCIQVFGFHASKLSAQPVSRNGCWIESASRALRSYASPVRIVLREKTNPLKKIT